MNPLFSFVPRFSLTKVEIEDLEYFQSFRIFWEDMDDSEGGLVCYEDAETKEKKYHRMY